MIKETLFLDNISSEKSNMGGDGKGYKEVKIMATKGAESIEKGTYFPAPAPALIHLTVSF